MCITVADHPGSKRGSRFSEPRAFGSPVVEAFTATKCRMVVRQKGHLRFPFRLGLMRSKVIHFNSGASSDPLVSGPRQTSISATGLEHDVRQTMNDHQCIESRESRMAKLQDHHVYKQRPVCVYGAVGLFVIAAKWQQRGTQKCSRFVLVIIIQAVKRCTSVRITNGIV